MAKVADGKSYIITNIGSKTVVDASGTPALNGSIINGYELAVRNFSDDMGNQIWKAKLELTDSTGQWFSFTNKRAGTAIDNSNGGDANGNRIQDWTYVADNLNQQWLCYRVNKGQVPVFT